MNLMINSLFFIILQTQTKPKTATKMTILDRVWYYLNKAYDSFLSVLNEVFSPKNIAQTIKGIILMIIIIVISKILMIVLRWVIKSWIRLREKRAAFNEIQRAKTIGHLFANLSKYAIVIIASILTLQGFNVDITAIVASVGIVGLAVGFGAQTLVKDIISGFFLLFEGDLAVGDEIMHNGQWGSVEAIGVRATKVRGFNGELRVIPNGDLSSFGNLNRGFMKSIVIINIPYESKFNSVFGIVTELANRFAELNTKDILEKPETQGIISFGASSVDIRVVFKVRPTKQYEVERNFRVFLKQEFETRNIEIPFPRQVVFLKNETQNDKSAN